MAKSVSGKSVLITNILVFILGVFLILIVVAIAPPPKSVRNNNKYISISTEDIFYDSPSSTEPFLINVEVYDSSQNGNIVQGSSNSEIDISNGQTGSKNESISSSSEFYKLRQSWIVTQQQKILNVKFNKDDLIVVSFLRGTNLQNKFEYRADQNYDNLTTLYITKFNIYDNTTYIRRNTIKAVSLTSFNDNSASPNPQILQSNGVDQTVVLSNPDYYYKSQPKNISIDDKKYEFSSIDFGLPLNQQVYITNAGSIPLTVTSLTTTATVVGEDATGKKFLQLCCGTVGCGAGFSGPGNLGNMAGSKIITSDDLCTAVDLII